MNPKEKTLTLPYIIKYDVFDYHVFDQFASGSSQRQFYSDAHLFHPMGGA